MQPKQLQIEQQGWAISKQGKVSANEHIVTGLIGLSIGQEQQSGNFCQTECQFVLFAHHYRTVKAETVAEKVVSNFGPVYRQQAQLLLQ